MEQQAVLKENSGSFLEADSTVQVEQIKPATWSDYLYLTKPGITISNLLTTFTGLWLAASGSLDLKTTIFTLIGTAFVIASGAALNNYWDRELDLKMKRTKNRAVATGRIHPRNALAIGIALLLAGLIVLGLFVNTLAAVVSLIGHIFYVLLYTPLKRVTTLNTVVGGVSGAVPPVIGWVAVTGTIDPSAWILFTVIFLWQFPHFLALAMMKVEDYRNGDVMMLPVVKGFEETKRQILRYTAALLPASLLLFAFGTVGYIYLTTAVVLGVIYLYLAFKGFFATDDNAWAKKMFGYSLVYLLAICGSVIVSTL
ncbi:heme o synthase [Brevibacillus sp. SYSU BS000544]|uniref:heme o synthase n=1 Tax=Brevibacillus sp. SYSU BS000544 TaxID=3416443 RepID=UPI003CE47E15